MNAPSPRWYLVASIIPLAIALFYLGAVSLAYRKLPQNVPVHFDLQGVANGWMNRTLWLIFSPALLATMAALVFTTRPAPLNLSTILYWCASGLVTGAFFQINRAAQAHRPFHFLPVFAWLLAVPICEFLLALASERWWKSLS